jgi:hypothetical protein
MKKITIISILAALLVACNGKNDGARLAEDKSAKIMLQGVWLDTEDGSVSFRVEGDTIYYADSTSMPSYFKIVGDSLVLASGTKYGIVKQSEHQFWFNNQNGDVVKLEKSEDPDDEKAFVHDTPAVLSYTHQVKSDSVVQYGGERYHWYIAINPTKYKVTKHSYSEDGIEVENVYYDNIMHISVYKGASCIYSSDFRKQQYADKVPADFLEEAVLGKMEFSHIDAQGLHFNATLCIPDGASCYLVESLISYKGQMTMKLVEY